MRSILLTGASGFLGSHLAKAIIQTGERLVVLKRRTSNLHRLADVERAITFYDLEDLNTANPFAEESIDVVVHTATNYGRAGEPSDQIYAANLHFPAQLLELAQAAKVPSFINVDTVIPPNINPYSLSKHEFCQMGYHYTEQYAMDFINVRLEHLYGIGDDAHKFVPWLVHACLGNQANIPLTAGEQLRDFIEISDATSGFLKILAHLDKVGSGFQEISLGSGQAISIKAFANIVKSLTRSSSHLNFGEIAYRNNEPMCSLANLMRMTELQWKPIMDLEQGLGRMITSLLQQEFSS